MKLGGWRTRSAFERYAIVSRTEIGDAMQKLQQSEQDSRIGRVTIHAENFQPSDALHKSMN